MLGICLVLAGAAAAAPVFIPATHFTLAWTHSIEKVRWEEDWRVLDAPPRLEITAARVRGSAAGMEPPDDAQLKDGWYTYRPATPAPDLLRLTRSPYTADFDLCPQGQGCAPMGRWLASDGGVTLLSACTSSPRP